MVWKVCTLLEQENMRTREQENKRTREQKEERLSDIVVLFD